MTVLICVFGTASNCFSCDIQRGEKPSNVQEAVHLILEKEAGVHLLSPAFLQLSPHQTWLATVGRDGMLCICEISTMVLFVKTNLHKFIHIYEYWAKWNMFLGYCPNIWWVCKCVYFWHAGQVCAAAVPLMLAGWSRIGLFHSRQSEPHHLGPEGRLTCLQQAQVSSGLSKNFKQTNTVIALWSIAILSLSGSFKMLLKLGLKPFRFYNAFKFNSLKLSGAGKANAATQYAQSVADCFESVVSSENTVLSKMTDWDPQTQSLTRRSSSHTGEVQKRHFLMFK